MASTRHRGPNRAPLGAGRTLSRGAEGAKHARREAHGPKGLVRRRDAERADVRNVRVASRPRARAANTFRRFAERTTPSPLSLRLPPPASKQTADWQDPGKRSRILVARAYGAARPDRLLRIREPASRKRDGARADERGRRLTLH